MAKKKGESTRAGGQEYMMRVDKAQEMLLLGATNRQVENHLIGRFDVSRRQARRYVDKVYERWRESAQEEDGRTIEEKRQQHEEMIRMILVGAAKRENLSLQLKAVEMLMKLSGTHQPHKVEVTGKDGGPIDLKAMSDEELKRLIAEAGVVSK